MRKQGDITHTMRSILVDWLVEVAEEYKLSRETLCLTVSCIDRFLSVMSVVRSKLQLVGAAAMFIAAYVMSRIDLLFECSVHCGCLRMVWGNVRNSLPVFDNYCCFQHTVILLFDPQVSNL